MNFQVILAFILLNVAYGDLIGWNRGRNTARKHLSSRYKSNLQIIDQYLKFYKNQNKFQNFQEKRRKYLRNIRL